MPGKFYLPFPNFPQSDLGRPADSRWALPQISSFIFNVYFWCNVVCVPLYKLVNKININSDNDDDDDDNHDHNNISNNESNNNSIIFCN